MAMRIVQHLKTVMLFFVLITLPQSGFASNIVIKGFLDKNQVSELVIHDSKGNAKEVRITKNTRIIDKKSLRSVDINSVFPGTRLSVTVQDNEALVVVLEEVPK